MKNSIKLLSAALIMFAAIGIFSVSAFAATGTINVESVNVRSGAGTEYGLVAGATYGTTVTIESTVKGSDGSDWYQITLSDGTQGYVKATLVSSGDAPAAGAAEPVDTSAVTTEGISRVIPVSAVVSGSSSSIRVRSDASADSNKVTTVKSADVITVTGTKLGDDGKTWYYVSFIVDSNEVYGFIRSDFVELQGELAEYVEPEPAPAPEVNEAPAPAPVPTPEPKEWDTTLMDEDWYLIDSTTGEGYQIANTLNYIESSKKEIASLTKKSKTKTAVIIVLLIICLASLGISAFLFMKLSEDSNRSYVKGIDEETRRKRMAQNGQNAPQGAPRTRSVATPQGVKTTSNRPTQAAGRPVQTQRPMQGQNTSTREGERPVKKADDPITVSRPEVRSVSRPKPSGEEFDLDFLDDNGGRR